MKKQEAMVNHALNDLILENQKLQKILKEKLQNKKRRMLRVQEVKKAPVKTNKKTQGILLPSAKRYVKEDFDSLLDWEDKDEPQVRDLGHRHPSKTKKYKTPAEFLEQDPEMFEEVRVEKRRVEDPIYKITSRSKRRRSPQTQRADIFETLDYVALAHPGKNYKGVRGTRTHGVPVNRQRVRIRRKHKNRSRNKKKNRKRGRKLNRDEKLSLWNFQMGIRNPGSTNSNDLGNDAMYYQVSKQMKNGNRALFEYKQWKVKNGGNGKFRAMGVGWKHYYEKYQKDRKVNPYVAGIVDHVNGNLNYYNGVSVNKSRSRIQATARLGAEIKLDQFLNMDVYVERGGQTLEFVDANGTAIPLKSKNTILGMGLNYIW